jgi:hypothetical protein
MLTLKAIRNLVLVISVLAGAMVLAGCEVDIDTRTASSPPAVVEAR